MTESEISRLIYRSTSKGGQAEGEAVDDSIQGPLHCFHFESKFIKGQSSTPMQGGSTIHGQISTPTQGGSTIHGQFQRGPGQQQIVYEEEGKWIKIALG